MLWWAVGAPAGCRSEFFSKLGHVPVAVRVASQKKASKPGGAGCRATFSATGVCPRPFGYVFLGTITWYEGTITWYALSNVIEPCVQGTR